MSAPYVSVRIKSPWWEHRGRSVCQAIELFCKAVQPPWRVEVEAAGPDWPAGTILLTDAGVAQAGIVGADRPTKNVKQFFVLHRFAGRACQVANKALQGMEPSHAAALVAGRGHLKRVLRREIGNETWFEIALDYVVSEISQAPRPAAMLNSFAQLQAVTPDVIQRLLKDPRREVREAAIAYLGTMPRQGTPE